MSLDESRISAAVRDSCLMPAGKLGLILELTAAGCCSRRGEIDMTQVDETKLNELVGRVLGDLGGAVSVPLVRIGD
jgi:hypothetical protein